MVSPVTVRQWASKGQLSAHDVVASDTVVFTIDSLASVGGKVTYDVSESDFELEAEPTESDEGGDDE